MAEGMIPIVDVIEITFAVSPGRVRLTVSYVWLPSLEMILALNIVREEKCYNVPMTKFEGWCSSTIATIVCPLNPMERRCRNGGPIWDNMKRN